MSLYTTRELQKIGKGDKAFVVNMLSLFCKQSRDSTFEMQEAEKQQDLSRIKKIAHKQKASIDILKIKGLMEIVRKIEASTAIPPNLIEAYCSQLNQVICEIEKDLS